jgi:Tol biopolymer transport system component
MHANGGTVDNLADSWSPAGTKIAFASNLQTEVLAEVE